MGEHTLEVRAASGDAASVQANVSAADGAPQLQGQLTVVVLRQ